MLVGREAECARIDRLLAEVPAGRSGTLVLRGEPGIGKSALLDYAVERAGGFRILSASGVESEAELPFATLHELLVPVLERIDDLPAPQAAALSGALALAPPAEGDRFTIYAATLGLLGMAAEDGPLLCIVDDAQWLDAASAEGLVFACRRLGAEGVCVLVAARTGDARSFEARGLDELTLGGLDAHAAEALLPRGEAPLEPDLVARLIALTGGNPLALLELPQSLSRDQLAGLEEAGEPLRVGTRLEQAFLARVERLPHETKTALLVAAASDTSGLDTISAALTLVGVTLEALEPAEAAGLITIAPPRLAFRHPLVRSSLYHAADPGERRRAHAALAEASLGQDSAARRAWHLAAAQTTPDERVAKELEDVALDARGRGGHAAAANAFARSARLTPERESRARRLLAAAQESWIAGREPAARGLIDEALGDAEDALLRADLEQLRGRIQTFAGENIRDAHALLVREAERVTPLNPARAALMMAEATLPCFMAGDVPRAFLTAKRAVEIAEAVGGVPAIATAVCLAEALVLRGDANEATELLELGERAIGAGGPLGPVALVTQLGYCYLWTEDFERAERIMARLIDAARAQSAPAVLPFALATFAEHELRVGRLASAYASADESVTLGSQMGQDATSTFSYATLGRIEAMLGDEAECRSHVERALAIAVPRGLDSIRVYCGAALGLLELGLGQPSAAIDHLEPLIALSQDHGVGEPSAVPWRPDLIEAYIRDGHLAEARQQLDVLEQQAAHTGRTWALAAAARCRGLLADDGFDSEFEEALRRHAATPTPFERARTDLCYGERLRRAGRRLEARDQLRAALATFDGLGAAHWATRARAELAASGQRVKKKHPHTSDQLTPQELQVALVVARGSSNKEAAAHLFLSPKTIEFHLGNVYRKLGVRSRTQLANAIDPGRRRSPASV